MANIDIITFLGITITFFVAFMSLYKAWKFVPKDIKELEVKHAKYPKSLDRKQSWEEWNSVQIEPWEVPIVNYQSDLGLFYPSGSSYDVETGAILPYTQLNQPNLIHNVTCRYCGATNNPKDNLECRKCGAPIVVK